MSDATLITVAPTGAEVDKAKVPALPVTIDELVGTAKECESVGASIIHVHIRDDAAMPTLDLGRLRDLLADGSLVLVAAWVGARRALLVEAVSLVASAPLIAPFAVASIRSIGGPFSSIETSWLHVAACAVLALWSFACAAWATPARSRPVASNGSTCSSSPPRRWPKSVSRPRSASI